MNEPAIVRTPELIGEEIRFYTGEVKKMTLVYGVEIGKRLVEAKNTVEYGRWGDWLERETEFSRQTANRFMQLYEEYGKTGLITECSTLSKVSVSNALALLAVPAEEREQVAEETDAGNSSARELAEAIKAKQEADQARKRAEDEAAAAKKQADNALISANDRVAEAKKAQQEADEKAKRLTEELTALKNKPIDVAVQQPSEEDISKAAALATAELEEKAKKLADELKAATEEKEKADAALSEANAAKEEAAQKLAAVQAELDAKARELDAERKKEKLADPIMAEFNVVFKNVQGQLGHLIELAGKAEDGEKLRSAIKAVLSKFGEAVA